MPSRTELSREKLIESIKAQMGYPVICVELQEANFTNAVEEAELWIASHMGQVRRTEIMLDGRQGGYELPDDCEQVVDAAFPGRDTRFLPIGVDIDGAEAMYYGQLFASGAASGGFNSTVYQTFQHIETVRRTLGADREAHWEEYEKRLLVQPTEMTGRAIIWYLSDQLDYDRLKLEQKMLMRRYAAAVAKRTLGMIRSKYSEIPAGGGRISLNGSELIASAETELAELNEKIMTMVAPMRFFTG